MNAKEILSGKLIVSCQALPDEPLHGGVFMERMAAAASQGGAGGIIANGPDDTRAIKQGTVALPVIGVLSRAYPNSPVMLTATMREVDELVEAGVDIVALDVTARLRPAGESLAQLVSRVRRKYSALPLIAEISTFDEALQAESLGFDCISSAMVGYTDSTRGRTNPDDDFALIRSLRARSSCFLIAEGGIKTPEQAAAAMRAGAHAVTVGSAITRPQFITSWFSRAVRDAIKNNVDAVESVDR
ncbi:hypothetical protein VL15_03740 [Burkholderia cepacia]|uniref:Putative N-acetylmannosamine-6-phosphate 2-epimerase n=1 Tax=Burkholderia cepacia TaxID=292 RepID=A0A0J6A933_BURCE|nr:N-acetylmannosamine-6-phosphate 2-epimerase [Burkholderia cepacia]KML62305.1 hypothetical protein VL15_03740 [Burkholderia cepacia]